CVQERAHRVHDSWVIAREQLEREQRRASARRALVLQPAAQQLFLLAKAELPDGSIGCRPLAVIGRSRCRLELVGPGRTQAGALTFVAALGESVRFDPGLGEAQTDVSERSAGPTYSAEGRNSRPVRFCSRMCADHPATREQANIAGASAGGICATSSTIA